MSDPYLPEGWTQDKIDEAYELRYSRKCQWCGGGDESGNWLTWDAGQLWHKGCLADRNEALT